MIFIDADASTAIADFDFDHLTASQTHDLVHDGPGIPYNLRPGAKTLIIGPGGGWDVSRALASGSHDVTGVEINPIIGTKIMREKYPQLSQNLYSRPDVHIHIEDGRSYVRRSPDKYPGDSGDSGGHVGIDGSGRIRTFGKQSLHHGCVSRLSVALTPDGLLTFTRWGFDPPRESLRLVSLAIAALADLGEHDAWRHVLVGRTGDRAKLNGFGALDTVIISRSPLSDADVARARQAFAEAHMEAVYLPGDPPA